MSRHALDHKQRRTLCRPHNTLLLLLVTGAGIGAFATPAQAGVAITSFKFQSTPSKSKSAAFPSAVLQSNKKGQFGIVFKIKNTGKARTNKVAATTFISGRKFDTQTVGPIAAGRTKTVRKGYNEPFRGPGIYDAHVCVGKRCSKHVRFAAVPRRWRVDSFTTGPNSLAGVGPMWDARAEDMIFDFFGTVTEQEGASGRPFVSFLWLATGTVRGSTFGSRASFQGQPDAFTFEGQGAVSHSPWDALPPDRGYLAMSPTLDGYFAEVRDENHAYVVTMRGGPEGPVESESAIATLETIGPDGRVDRPMSPTDTKLSGDYRIEAFGPGATVGQWAFSADLP